MPQDKIFENQFRDVIEKRPISVVIQTEHNVIMGETYIRPNIRLIDEINKGDQFLALTNATVYDLRGKASFRSNFISINREHIVWITPKDEMVVSLPQKADRLIDLSVSNR